MNKKIFKVKEGNEISKSFSIESSQNRMGTLFKNLLNEERTDKFTEELGIHRKMTLTQKDRNTFKNKKVYIEEGSN